MTIAPQRRERLQAGIATVEESVAIVRLCPWGASLGGGRSDNGIARSNTVTLPYCAKRNGRRETWEGWTARSRR